MSTATIYTDADYGGLSMQLGVGRYDEADLGLLRNNTVSSIKVPTGYKVTLFEGATFTGAYMVAVSNMKSLHRFRFDDKTSSIMVEQMTMVPGFRLQQLEALIQTTAPTCRFHPKEKFKPSSVDWFLERATLVRSDGSSQPASSGLSASGGDDGSDWLTIDSEYRDGDLSSAVAYVHAKWQNQYYIDLQYWFFYPYNGGATGTVKVAGMGGDIDLTPMGEHGGDWERATFRIELSTGKMIWAYLAQHGSGRWYKPSDLEYEGGRPVVYSSRHGHATYPTEGKHLTNSTSLSAAGVTWFEFGLRNDTAAQGSSLGCHSHYQIISADFAGVTEPQWLSYPRRWGPYIAFSTAAMKKVVETALDPFNFEIYPADAAADAVLAALPSEMKEENGPIGPKLKPSWSGHEDA